MTEIQLLDKSIACLRSEPKLEQRFTPVIESFEKQRIRAQQDRCRIGVIGVTSSGKSTMINAILGDKLLSMAVSPSSSQLVTCSKSREKKATVYFVNKPCMEIKGKALTPDIIRKYSDENVNSNNVEQVTQLELSTPSFDFPEDILLVDSPGLDAYGLDGHERITMNSLLPTIDFCIFVTTLKTNSDEKMRTVLNTIAEYNCPIIIVQNMLDSVRPSADGKKSSIDVANEHKIRVEKIVQQSDISDKSSVRIVQISSKLALEGRLEKDDAKLAQSNYRELLCAVQETLNRIKPRIEFRRTESIRKRLKEIADAPEYNNKSHTKNRVPLRFEFEGADITLKKDTGAARAELEQLVGVLMIQKKQLQNPKFEYEAKTKSAVINLLASAKTLCKQIINCSSFSENDIDKIKELVKTCEDKLLDVMKKHNKRISQFCKKLGVDERRLRVIDSFGQMPALTVRTKTKSYRVEKRGFGQGFLRKLADVFDTDWGYEYETQVVFDRDKSRSAAVDYLDNVVKLFNANCKKWVSSVETAADELCDEIENRRQEYKARQEKVEDEQAMQRFIERLNSLIGEIPAVCADKKSVVEHSDTDLKMSLSTMAVSRSALAVYDLAEHIKSEIHRQVYQQANLGRNPTVILSWDPLSTTMLLKNAFGKIVSDDDVNGSTIRYGNITVIPNPDKQRITSVAAEYRHSPADWLVLFNATQFGAAQNSLAAIELNTVLRKQDNLFLIAQDFEELRNGGGVREALRNMKTVCDEIGISNKPFILLNDNNPIYSLAAIQVQKTPHITESQEVQIIKALQTHFPYLRNPKTDNVLSDIIRALK